MTITNLNTLQSGTLASVAPVNENFETLRVGVNTLENTVTNNRTYLDGKVSEINTNIANSVKSVKTAGEIFCLNSGPVDAYGNAYVLTYSGATLSFNTPFVATNIKGEIINVQSVSSISLGSNADGVYHVFIDTDGEAEVFACDIYKQKTAPAGVLNNIWLDTSSEPLKAKRYTADGWVDFLKVPVGNLTVSNGTIQYAGTFTYNQNGYNVNRDSIVPVIYPPDFSRGVNKANEVNYTAETYGWVYVFNSGVGVNAYATFFINGQSYSISYSQFYGSLYGSGGGFFVPIPKGAAYAASNATAFVFYPAYTY